MTESQVERAAEAVLAAHGVTDLPIDPLAIARLEQIRLAPGRYGGCFDGRIEYRRARSGGCFYLFYEEEAPPRRPASRVRFSVAHELGHFFLPSHRDYLLSREWCGARPERLRSRRVEREADWFAAALLMPRAPFAEHVRALGAGPRRLGDLARLADRVFRTSLTSTALRYAQLDFAPCCVVVSDPGRVLFGVSSDCLKLMGAGWVNEIPGGSVTARLRASARQGGGVVRGRVRADLWFEGLGPGPLWEEAKVLGRTGRVLTYLTLPGEGAASEGA